MSVLKKVFALVGISTIATVGTIGYKRLYDKEKKARDYGDKMNSYYHILNHWLKLKQQGISCQDYFRENNYKRIAIYGFKELGERLYDELKGSDIEVVYVIDKDVDGVWAEVDVFGVDEEFPDVDAIIVTPTWFFIEVEETLSRKAKCPIVSLEDVIL